MTKTILFPIVKIVEHARLVVARLPAETPGAGVKAFFEAWSTAGGEKSLNAMAGRAAGQVTSVTFDGDDLEIIARIDDEDEWAKALEGVYTGVAAQPGEIALIDHHPLLTSNSTFSVVRSGGTEIRKFRSAIAASAKDEIEKRLAAARAAVDAHFGPLDALLASLAEKVDALYKSMFPAAERVAKCGTRAPDEPVPARAALRAPVQETAAAAGPMTVDKMAAEFAKMSPEERALALTKLSLANPSLMIRNVTIPDDEKK